MLDLVTSLVILVACFVLIQANWDRLFPKDSSRRELLIPTEPVSIVGSELIGSSAAPVVLVEFTDFQCPFCAKFANEVLPTLIKEFVRTGQVAVAVRHLPLERIHPMATTAALSAKCSGRVGKFTEAHDWLFQNYQRLQAAVTELPRKLGLAEDNFKACVAEQEVAAAVREDIESARRLGVKATPAFFVGTRAQVGRVLIKRSIAGAAEATVFRDALTLLVSSR